MSSEFRTPCDRILARRRHSRTIAWLLFLAFIASIFVARAVVKV